MPLLVCAFDLITSPNACLLLAEVFLSNEICWKLSESFPSAWDSNTFVGLFVLMPTLPVDLIVIFALKIEKWKK